DGPIINEGLTLSEETKDYQREIVVPKGQDSIRVREFKDGYFEYKDIALEDISNFDNIMITESNSRAKLPTKTLPGNLQMMHPLDGEPNLKNNSPGKRNKRRGGSTMSNREHFANYDKMVTNKTTNPNNNRESPSPLLQTEGMDGFEANVEYQPSDRDVIKKLFAQPSSSSTGSNHVNYAPQQTSPFIYQSQQLPTKDESFPQHQVTTTHAEPKKALLSPSFFMNSQPLRTHPPQPPGGSVKPTSDIHAFFKSVENESAASKHLEEHQQQPTPAPFIPPQQHQQQYLSQTPPPHHPIPSHHIPPPHFHTPPHAHQTAPPPSFLQPHQHLPTINLNQQLQAHQYHPQQHQQPKVLHLAQPVEHIMDDFQSPRSPVVHSHHPHAYTTPPHNHFHQKSLSYSGGETIPNFQNTLHQDGGLKIVNSRSGAITTGGNSIMTEAEILASLMPSVDNNAKVTDSEKKKTERYAGGMWTSSPPPSSLPVPRFKTAVKKCV
ncbi:hypothetical protein AKO1_002306, partial [Acrasis kona]